MGNKIFSLICIWSLIVLCSMSSPGNAQSVESVNTLKQVVDVKVEDRADKVSIGIITSNPILFDARRGVNKDSENYLTIEFPYTTLAWSNGENKNIVVNKAGVKEIVLSQSPMDKESVFKTEAKIMLFPESSYEIRPAFDARGIIVDVMGKKEEIKEVTKKEEAVEVNEVPSIPINIDLVDADILYVLKILGEQSGLNIVTDSIVKGKVTVHLKDVGLRDALDLVLAAHGLAYKKIGNSILIAPEEKIAKQNITSEVIKLRYISAKAAKEMLKGTIEDDHLRINEDTNMIIITSTLNKIQEARRIIKEAEKPLPQVLLNAKVVEVSVDVARELGIDWSDSLSTTFREATRLPSFEDDAAITGGATFHMYRIARTALEFESALKLLETKGDANILSNPQIMTLNGKVAEIFIGDRIPYTITTVTGGVATTEVRFSEPGIRLKITPTIIENDFMVAEIEPEVSYIYSWRGPQDAYPWIKTREAKSNVRIKNGETIVLGGLLSKEDKKVISKVPGLSSIPIFGGLFRNNKKTGVDNELIITVTPTILR